MSRQKTDSDKGIKNRDPDMIGAEAALKRAAAKARERARQAGHGIMVWENGRVVEVREDTPPDE